MKHIRRTNKKGFSLLEVLVATFIFTIVILTTASIFSRIVTAQRKAKAIQRNMEDARFVLESMSKTIRTGTVLKCATDDVGTEKPCMTPGTITALYTYDYSQAKCIKYSFVNAEKKLKISEFVPISLKSECKNNASYGPAYALTGNFINNARFKVIQSMPPSPGPSRVGMVTIAVQVCAVQGCSGSQNDISAMETTASMRDYQAVYAP